MVDKSYLIAIGELGAAVTLTPDFLWQLHFVYLRKAKLAKEGRLIGKTKDGRDAELPGFLQTGGYQTIADALLLTIFSYRHRLYLRQVRPGDVKCGTGDYPLPFSYRKVVPDIFIYFAQRTGKHLTPASKEVN